jgi:hypothetical protein
MRSGEEFASAAAPARSGGADAALEPRERGALASRRTAALPSFAVGLWAVLLAAAALISLRWPMYKDAPLMSYAASRFLDGDRPYLDLFEMNMPGTYLVAIAGQVLFGESALGLRLLDLLLLSGFGWSAWRFTLPFAQRTRVVAVLLPVTCHLVGGPYDAMQRDWLLAVAAFGAVTVLFERSTKVWRPLLAGALLGVASTIKPQALLLALAVLALFAWRASGRRVLLTAALWDQGRARRDLLLVPLGMAIAVMGVFGWLWRVGSLPAFVELNRDYVGPLYSRLDGSGHEYHGLVDMLVRVPANVWGSVMEPRSTLAVIALLASATGLLWWRSAPPHDGRTIRVATLVSLCAYGLVHFIVGFRPWTYYWMPFLSAGAVLAALALELPSFAPTDRLRTGARVLAAGVIATGLLLTVSTLVQPPDRAADIAPELAATERMVNALTTRAEPGDRVQTLDTATGAVSALQRSGLEPATRFMYDFHFFHHPGSAETSRLRNELIAELTASPPRFILATSRSWAQRDSFESFERFPELQDLLDEYRVVERDPWFRLFERQK